ncbi:MAG: amidase family protein, partial [Paracoccaceae bacterium]
MTNPQSPSRHRPRTCVDVLALDAVAQSRAMACGTLRAVDLMAATLERIAALNPTLNAVVSLQSEASLMAAAEAADQSPRRGWMHGLPIAVKDLADVAGLPTSYGSPLFAKHVAARDSGMVARMRAAGAIFIGKTNTPEFGLGSHTFNPVHGVTAN